MIAKENLKKPENMLNHATNVDGVYKNVTYILNQ